MDRIMQMFLKNKHDWNIDLKSSSISFFNSNFRYIKILKIIVLFIFLFLIGITFFLILLLNPHRGGFLVPISIINYEDISISNSGSLRINLSSFQNKFSLNMFPGISSTLQTEKDILDFLIKKDKACIHDNIIFRIDGRALPSGEGDIILLPSNYGTSSTVNGIELSEILCLIMEFPCKNRLVLIDVMAPWNNIGHGALLWDLGLEINKSLELAKSKFKNKNGKSAESINFHMLSAAGEGSFSRQLGVTDTLFYDQIYYTFENLIPKKIGDFSGLFILKNIIRKVISEINKTSVQVFGVSQNPFFIGWGREFPFVEPKKNIKIGGVDQISTFIWPEEYSKAWFYFHQLKEQKGYEKSPKIMFSILTTLLNFQNVWTVSNFEPNILKSFNSDIKYYSELMIEVDKNNNKLSSLVSVGDMYSRFTDIELKKYRVLFNSTFGNLKIEKDEVLLQSLKSKEFITAIEKLSPVELEFLLIDSIIESSNFNFYSINSILDFIYKHHKDLLAIETFGLNRYVTSSKIYPEFKDIDFCKTLLRSRIECNKLFYVLFKNELMFNGMRKSMDSLDKGDWLLEHGGGGQMSKIISLYNEAEKTSKLTFLASKSFQKAVTLLDSSLIELFHATESSFPATVVLFPVLDKLEKLGKYVLKCELEMESFPSQLSIIHDDKNINDKLSEFIYITDLIVSPFESELNNLKVRINDDIIPSILNNDGSSLWDNNYISGKFGAHIPVFADNKNLIKYNDFMASKINGLRDLFHSQPDYSSKSNTSNDFDFYKKNDLALVRYNLILVQISLMRSIGLDGFADKLSNLLKKVDSSQSRSKSWNELIKLLPRMFFSEINILESSLNFSVRDRLSYIFRRSNYSPSSITELTKTKQRLDHHLIMVENVLNNRFNYGLDGDFCLKIIQQIASYSLPLVPVQRFIPQGDMSVIIFENNKNEVQRNFSFSGLVLSDTMPKIELVEKNDSKCNFLLDNVIFEKVPDSKQYKITGKFNISLLKNYSVIVPFYSSLLLKITYDFQSDYFNIPVLVKPNKPELELIFRKINGDLLEDNFKSRTLLEGEKYSIFVRNNSLKPREAYVKMSSGSNKLFLADSKVVCPDNEEVSVNFKPKTPPVKTDAGFSFEFSSHDNIFIEISDNLKPSNVYQQRLFNPSIIDPINYLFVQDAKYYPTNLPSYKNPSIRLNLMSLNKNLIPQPFVDLSIDQSKTPSFKSGTGATALFLKSENSVELFLKDINFDYNLPDTGEVHVNIDNFKRCFRYGFNITPFGSPYLLSLIKKNEVRFSGEFSFSDQKILTFPIQTDGGTLNSTIEVGLFDDKNTDSFPTDFSRAELHTTFLSVRNNNFRLLQKQGESLFSLFSFVDDWKIHWDVSGSVGKKVVHAVMKDDKGQVISKISKSIVVDFSLPKLSNFKILSDLVVPGKSVRFAINASDQESGISKITSSFVKSGGEKSVLVDIPLVKNEDFLDQFIGSFLVPLDLKSPIDISITVFNGLGRSSILTKTIQLSGVTVTSTLVVTSIKGVVKEGGRLQPGLVVTLYDTKSKKSKFGTTDANGEFMFDKLEPLVYKISVEKPSSSRTATKVIDLNSGQTVDVNLELLQ
jgi:Carboxypeptidase regulatory-like domain